jgi:transcriptional regulator with XRE-family HTH domain
LELLDGKTIVTQNKTPPSDTNSNSVYQNFAQNLFSLATRGGSIAQTCRDLNINRQQFNKYLSGAVLPNAETLSRITEHFRVDALVLFGPPDGLESVEIQTSDEKLPYFSKWRFVFEEFFEKIITQNTQNEIAEGVYNFYLPWNPDTSRCVKGIIIFRKIDGLIFFTRIVRYRMNTAADGVGKIIVIDGVASQEQGRLSLVGRTRHDEHTMRMLSVDTTFKTPGGYFVGLMLANNPQGRPLAVKFAMKHVGTVLEWRKFFRTSGVFNLNSPSLPSEVLQMADLGFNSDIGELLPPDLMSEWKKI